MQNLNTLVENARNQTLKVYLEDSARITQDLNIERENMDGYAGREILELMQNAVDQLSTDSSSVIEIRIKNNLLSISNTGVPFSFAGIKSIMVSNNSPKKNNDIYIGNKGLGFRSVLNWSNKIRIFSENLSVEFSQQFSRNFFNASGIKDEVATLVAPQPIKARNLGTYVTQIELYLNDDVLDDVKRQINQIKPETLLFLDKVKTLVIIVDDKIKKLSRQQNHQLVHVECDDDGAVSSKDYQLFEDIGTMPYVDTDGKPLSRKYKIVVVYDNTIDTKNNRIHNYFATKINIPIRWHVHATFELSSDRNTIIENSANEVILEKLATLLSVSAESLDEVSGWDKLESVIPDGDFSLALDIAGNEFYDVYISKIMIAKILPLYGGGYISIADKPVVLENELHSFLSPVHNLLEYTSDQTLSRFIRSNGEIHKPNYKVVCSNLKSKLTNITIEDRATCIILLSREYEYISREYFIKNTPSIFIDNNYNAISNGNVYLAPQEKISALPNFVRIKTMNNVLQGILANKLNMHGARPLTNALSAYNVHEYSLRPIIEKMNSSLNKKFSTDNYKAYIKWLFENRELLSDDIPILLIAKDGTLQKSGTLYLTDNYSDSSYNNSLLFKADRLIADFVKFGINSDDKVGFINFLTERNVADVPRDIAKTINSLEDDYRSLIIEKYDAYPIDNDRIRQYKNHDIRDVNDLRMHFRLGRTIVNSYSIDGFDILLSLSTSEIITTLLTIPALLEPYDSEASIGYRDLFPYSASDRHLRNRIYSYTLYRLQSTPWILINNKKYSPFEIVLYSGIGEKVDGIIGISRDDLFKKSTVQEDERDALIRKLGIAKDFSELPEELLYRILLQAPDFDEDGKVSRKIYSDIAKGKKSTPSNKQAKDKFIEDGNLYTRTGQFVPVKDVVYTYKVTPKQLEERYNLLALPAKQGEKKIYDWFGVVSINIDVVAVGEQEIHRLNEEFQESEMQKNRTAVLAIKWDDYTTDRDRNRIKNIQIHLVNKLTARINSEDGAVELTDYSIAVDAKIKNKYYIKIPVNENNIRNLGSQVFFQNAVMDIFSQHLSLNDEEFTLRVTKIVSADLHNTRLMFIDSPNFIEAECYLLGKTIEDETNFIYENQRKLVRAHNNLLDYYRKALFVQLKEDLDSQKQWRKLLGVYSDYAPTNDNLVPNMREFDAESYIKSMFPILNNDIPDVDVDKLYGLTVNKLNKEFHTEYTEQLDRFYNTHEYLLRFGHFDEAASDFRNLYVIASTDFSKSDEEPENVTDNSDESIHMLSTATPTLPKDSGTAKNVVSTGQIDRQNKKRKSNGLKAEKLVYQKLKNQYGDDNVRWLSGFAREEGVNIGEAGDGLGYDFKITLDGEIQYIEVKSGVNKLSQLITFNMSVNEYSFAVKNKEQYKVLYVAGGVIHDTGFVFNLGHYIKVPDSYEISIGVDVDKN